MKEQSIVLSVISGEKGEILEKDRHHQICLTNEGKIQAVFENPSREDMAVKITFTALEPHAEFEVKSGEETYQKRANLAGILEFRMKIPKYEKVMLKEQ